MEYVYQQITDFTSSNLSDTYSDWSDATTYSLETDNQNLTNASMVRYGSYYYRSLINSNLNYNPEEYEDVYWVKHSISNKFAMLDLSSTSKSVFAGDMTVEFLQDGMDTLGIGYYTAETVLIEVLDTDNTTVLWSYSTSSTVHDCVEDYYTYIYCDYGLEADRAQMIKLGYDGYKVRVTFNKSTESTVTDCGFLVGGNSVDMGKTISKVKFSFTSYAYKKPDAFGALNITKRAVQDLVDFETVIDDSEFSNKKRKIKSIYNDIIMFIVDEDENSQYENLLTLGIIQDVKPMITDKDKLFVSWSIMEAI